jgi:hypothetical protein
MYWFLSWTLIRELTPISKLFVGIAQGLARILFAVYLCTSSLLIGLFYVLVNTSTLIEFTKSISSREFQGLLKEAYLPTTKTRRISRHFTPPNSKPIIYCKLTPSPAVTSVPLPCWPSLINWLQSTFLRTQSHHPHELIRDFLPGTSIRPSSLLSSSRAFS